MEKEKEKPTENTIDKVGYRFKGRGSRAADHGSRCCVNIFTY